MILFSYLKYCWSWCLLFQAAEIAAPFKCHVASARSARIGGNLEITENFPVADATRRSYRNWFFSVLAPSSILVNHMQALSHSRCSLEFASFRGYQGYHVLEAKSLDHPFKDWQEQRKHVLTASTFAAAVGFFPRRRLQLWLEKIEAIEPFSKSMAVSWTNIKTVNALENYKEVTKNSVLMFRELQVYSSVNARDDWLGASPDGLVYSADEWPSQGVLNIKCPYFGGDMSNAIPWKRIPLYFVPQAQGVMEILDVNWMHLYVWTIRGSSLFKIHRDAEYWDALEQVLSDFWWNHVQPAREIYSSSRNDTDCLLELRSIKPEPRHEWCSYIVNQSKRIVDRAERLQYMFHPESTSIHR